MALDTVNLTIAPGEMVAVIGRSGAGKSTFLRSLNRLNSPSSGDIRFEDISVGGAHRTGLARMAAQLRDDLSSSSIWSGAWMCCPTC